MTYAYVNRYRLEQYRKREADFGLLIDLDRFPKASPKLVIVSRIMQWPEVGFATDSQSVFGPANMVN
ncbi:MAG: hypothetical protein C4K47_02455 [Candidatus Thorarchaeota archaeon]|nr:MAG: hypothetical protein C4K47_02455 [Candidatus Thorarchaeota archaeon]